jgi:drug/metabolite transporter (DMT)-like permease
MVAVALASLAGVLFGAMSVALRLGLRRHADAEVGALVSVLVAFLVCAVAALVAWDGVETLADLWPYVLGGALAPGISQHLYVVAVREIGAARAGIVVGAAPLLSAAIAMLVLGEPLRWGLALGTLAIVGGGAALASERERPVQLAAVGAIFAAGCALYFGTRDNVVRWAAGETEVPPLLAAAVVVASGGLVLGGWLVVARGRSLAADVRRAAAPFAVAGFLFGGSYALILEAFERGKVTVVAPLVATESLWAVLVAALVLRRTEAVGSRLVLAATLVVTGGVLIGATR